MRRDSTSNVLVTCFMHTLAGVVPEEDRESVVSRSLRWNSRKESVKLKWKEVESRRMNYDNLLWRRKLVQDAAEQTKLMTTRDLDIRVQKFGSSSTALMVVSESRRSLERTLSHTSTRVGTSAKVAVRKIIGGEDQRNEGVSLYELS